jgi:uncharacterized protein YjbI with pentapeptide repeats
MKHQIKHRYTGAVLFETEIPDDTPSGLAVRMALEQATKAGVNLAGAYLAGANLDGAYLDRANLAGANLAGANLDGANLAGANLAGANLDGAYLDRAYLAGANLAGANLARANLAGANLDGAYLAGKRPIFQIGPIGSRSAYLVAHLTDKGVALKTGCFTGSVSEFEAKLQAEHGDNNHAQEYRAALALINKHAELWTEKVEVAA